MQLSARNVLKGKITNITKGAVAAEVQVELGGGDKIVSTVTVTSVDRLGLAPGKDVTVVVKASDVILGTE